MVNGGMPFPHKMCTQAGERREWGVDGYWGDGFLIIIEGRRGVTKWASKWGEGEEETG